MAGQRVDVEDQEALFNSYPSAMYYVHSPSINSHQESSFLSPFRSDNRSHDASRFTLSRYSSSRGSNNSFLHEKKIAYDFTKSGNCEEIPGDHNNNQSEEEDDDDNDGAGDEGRMGNGFLGISSTDSSNGVCVLLQITWRAVVSLGITLLLFYMATKPPTPKLSIKSVAIKQFGMGEGLDNSGVPTKILTCNSSVVLEIDNRSKFFALHIHPATLEMAFGNLRFANSYGHEIYTERDSLVIFRLYVGTKNRAMYGAGRSMEDMLGSGEGLPLVVRVSLRSSIRVVWDLIKSRFRHRVDCLLVLHGTYDQQLHTQPFNSTCRTSTVRL